MNNMCVLTVDCCYTVSVKSTLKTTVTLAPKNGVTLALKTSAILALHNRC